MEHTLFSKTQADADTTPLSDEQSEVFARIAAVLSESGLTLEGVPTDAMGAPGSDGDGQVMAVLGKAGTGKTLLLAALGKALKDAGLDQITADQDFRSRGKRRFAIIAPTNKAASVLRMRGVEATTIHRVIYTPVYDPEYERIAEWLRDGGKGPRPEHESLAAGSLDRALEYYRETESVPAAFATIGLRGSEFITGWAKRDESIDVGLVDESSMLDENHLKDLRSIFQTLILFGDPAQLAPVGQGGRMAFDTLPAADIAQLTHVHRQAAGNPILKAAYALEDPDMDFQSFEVLLRQLADEDERIVIAARGDPVLMATSPMLVWRNSTRIRLIWGFRRAFGVPETVLMPGEPLICDGAELPMKQRKKRMALEQAGLVKGAQVFYLGPGKKPGFARLHVEGAVEPRLSAASIIQLERGDDNEPILPFAARMGAVFLHGAACTIHKAQGSQWDDVQVFGPDLFAAAASGRNENGIPLWKRLGYVAITRAKEKLIWVNRYALSKPAVDILPRAEH